MVFDQRESQGQLGFKDKETRFHLLMGEATKKNFLACFDLSKSRDLENVFIGFYPPLVETPFRVFNYLVISYT